MSLSQLLVKELDREAVSTRKILQCVPDGQPEWKPHAKSFALNRLGSHVAELPRFLEWILAHDELDMSTLAGSRALFNTGAEMLQHFDQHIAEGRAMLEAATDEHLMQPWTFRAGERIIAKDTRYDCIRSWMMNHQIHHRGQLSVYLRLLEVPIPGMYGPSADDIIAREAAQAAKN
jgi:uncharacterized damage-inducible protein DinB